MQTLKVALEHQIVRYNTLQNSLDNTTKAESSSFLPSSGGESDGKGKIVAGGGAVVGSSGVGSSAVAPGGAPSSSTAGVGAAAGDTVSVELLKQQNVALADEIVALRAQLAGKTGPRPPSSAPSTMADSTVPGGAKGAGVLLPPADTSKTEHEDDLIDSWFQQDAVNLTLENDKLQAELNNLRHRFEKALQVIGKLQEENEKLKSMRPPG